MNDGIYQNDAPYRTGHLNKKITILKREEVTEDGITSQKMVDALGLKVWARIEPLRGSEYLEEYKVNVDELTRITIRYRTGIDESMQVMYRDRTYEIKTIIDPAESHTRLELMCKIHKVGKNKKNVSESNT